MRRKTGTVQIGGLTLSSEQPVMVQSMLNTSTMDVEACVEQAVRIITAGGELVRITAPGVKEAEKLKNIHAALRARGYQTPLSADIHFVAEAALVAARYVEKVRINPGNFIDKRATFKHLTYTEEEYAAELETLRLKFSRFLEVCREYGTAVRIGTNHGSLSDRIMSRYGNTPAGMVEATMEYLRVCKSVGFDHVVISLKSSDCQVMVDAVRLLVGTMEKEDMHYPLHLGVTEAGEGEDGRIRSAVGIGTLLNEGIGDTIRVSLTEAPEAEIPVARMLTQICNHPVYEMEKMPGKGEFSHPVVVADLSGIAVLDEKVSGHLGFKVCGEPDLVSGVRLEAGLKSPEVIYTETLGPELTKLPPQTWVVVPPELLDMAHVYNRQASPLLSVAAYCNEDRNEGENPVFIQINAPEEVDEVLLGYLGKHSEDVLVLAGKPDYNFFRKIFRRLAEGKVRNRVILRVKLSGENNSRDALLAASQLGGFFLDRLAWGIWIYAPDSDYAGELSRNILQSAGVRRYKAEFISCPGCGRTLFDLQGAVAKVKAAFGHLNTLKIAVMGCVVNGPGEMGDADYGYVGAGNGKVNLYKGRQMVRAAVPETEAIETLRELISKDNQHSFSGNEL